MRGGFPSCLDEQEEVKVAFYGGVSVERDCNKTVSMICPNNSNILLQVFLLD